MICLRCDRTEGFKTEKRLVEQLYRGKTLMVLNEVTVCPTCAYFTVTLDQADKLLKNTKSLYELTYGESDTYGL